jgi:hypothetical protein
MQYMTRSMSLNPSLQRHQPVKLMPASTRLPVVKADPISDVKLITSLHERTLRLLRQGDVMTAISCSEALRRVEARSKPVKLLPRYR